MKCHRLWVGPARKRAVRSSVTIVLSVLATGCLDAETVEPSDSVDSGAPRRLLIDDFEDGDRSPSNPNFLPWQCHQTANADQWQPLTWGATPLGGGSRSNYGEFVDFTLADTSDPNGVREYPSSQLFTSLKVPMNVRDYQYFVFDVRLVPGDRPMPKETYVRVHLLCLKMNHSPDVNYDFEIGAGVTPTNEWETWVLSIASFVQFEWLRQRTPIDERACAAAIDEVEFELQPNLLDGASTTGTLTIDNVYLQ